MRVNPAGQDRQTAQVVIHRRGFRINGANPRNFDHDAGIVLHAAFAIQQRAGSNHDPFALRRQL
ncbi:MAG: hypothetical protein ABSH50_30050 [Bryobacteraceae bacterium]